MLEVFHSRTATSLATWLALMTGAFTGVQWLIPEWFGTLTWPQSVLIGFFLALASTLVISMALALAGYGFRKFRPAPSLDQNAPVEVAPPTFYDDSHLVTGQKKIIESINAQNLRLDEVEAKDKIIIQDYQTVLGKQAMAADELDKLKEHLQREFEKLTTNITKTAEQVGATAAHAVIYRDDLRRSLMAIYDRERLTDLASQIETCAEALYQRIRDDDHHDAESWKDWIETHTAWNANLDMWLGVAKPYMRQVEFIVSVVNETEYDGDWSIKDHQVPTADDVRKFKRHRIINQHWTEVIPQVMHSVRRVAFEGAPPTGTEND